MRRVALLAVDDRLVIDLSAMRGVELDASGVPCTCRAVRRGPMSTASPRRWALATTGGVVSETGVASLALSGGPPTSAGATR
jgi:hypothetical protein